MLGIPRPAIVSTKGFTLIEVLLAILFLSVALLGTAALLESIISKNLLARQMTTATTMAQEKMEELKNTNAPSSGSPQLIGRFTREWAVASDTPESGMSTIEVRVSWELKGKPYNVVLRTCVAE